MAHQGYWSHHDTFPEGVKNPLMVMNGKILETSWENDGKLFMNGKIVRTSFFLFMGHHLIMNGSREIIRNPMSQLSQSFDMDELESMEWMESTPELNVDALPG